jgi:hypothetical protein
MPWTPFSYSGASTFKIQYKRKEAMEVLLESSDGREKVQDAIRYRLPDITSTGYGLFISRKDSIYPAKLKPVNPAQEKRVITAIITELSSAFALDLDASPSLDRGVALQVKPKKSVDFLLVGSSNARMLMDELSGMGYTVGLAHQTNFRIYRGSSESLIKQVTQAIGELDPGTVVFQLFDNSIYCVKHWDGSRRPPKPMDYGNHHIVGELLVENREAQLDMFMKLKPLLALADRRNAIMISPMPRYVRKSCCKDHGHCTNRSDPEYMQNMMGALAEAKHHIKNLLFHAGKRTSKSWTQTTVTSTSRRERYGATTPYTCSLQYTKR